MLNMRKIFVFGNPLVEEDSLALKVAKQLDGKLQGIEFVNAQSLDHVQSLDSFEKQDLRILDVAKGIEKVQVVEDLEFLETKQPISGHDFDLAMELKILKKVGKVGKVQIIAIPMEYDLEKAVEEVKKILS